MDRPTGLVVDAGPLYAALDRKEPRHAECFSLLESLPGPLIVPVLAVGEVAHLVARRLGAELEARFLLDLAAGGLVVEPVTPADWSRMAELVLRYHDLPLGTVDASIIAAAERLAIRTIVTLDRRHFSVVRPAHVEAFELLPG